VNHEDLAKQFNTFAFEIVQKHSSINTNITSLQDDFLLKRVVFNKYYYALYHKYLQYDKELREKSGSSKHDAILKKLQKNKDKQLFLTYKKLQNLRVWADYQLTDSPQAKKISLIALNQEVYNILKRTIIHC